MAECTDGAALDVTNVARSIVAIQGNADESAQGASFLRLAARDITAQTKAIRDHIENFALSNAPQAMGAPTKLGGPVKVVSSSQI